MIKPEELAVSLKHIQLYGNESDKVYLHINDVKELLENQKKEIIEKSCKWLDGQIYDSVIVDTGSGSWDEHIKSEFISDFKEHLEND